MTAREDGARIPRENYLNVLDSLNKKIKIEKAVKAEAVRRIEILANKSVTLGDNARAAVGAVVFGIEQEKSMPGRSPQIAQALDLSANSVTENSRPQAIHFRKAKV